MFCLLVITNLLFLEHQKKLNLLLYLLRESEVFPLPPFFYTWSKNSPEFLHEIYFKINKGNRCPLEARAKMFRRVCSISFYFSCLLYEFCFIQRQCQLSSFGIATSQLFPFTCVSCNHLTTFHLSTAARSKEIPREHFLLLHDACKVFLT